MEEGVFFQSNVNEHGLETLLDVFDAAFEDAADDIVVAVSFDRVFFEDAVFEEGHAALEGFSVNYDCDAFTGVGVSESEGVFDAFDHMIISLDC